MLVVTNQVGVSLVDTLLALAGGVGVVTSVVSQHMGYYFGSFVDMFAIIYLYDYCYSMIQFLFSMLLPLIIFTISIIAIIDSLFFYCNLLLVLFTVYS